MLAICIVVWLYALRLPLVCPPSRCLIRLKLARPHEELGGEFMLLHIAWHTLSFQVYLLSRDVSTTSPCADLCHVDSYRNAQLLRKGDKAQRERTSLRLSVGALYPLKELCISIAVL